MNDPFQVGLFLGHRLVTNHGNLQSNRGPRIEKDTQNLNHTILGAGPTPCAPFKFADQQHPSDA